MSFIRPASANDASRIAEIIITNYRVNFYPFFLNDTFYFGELNVVDMASEYTEGSQALANTFVYDDGIVKGIIRLNNNEIEKLYVEPQFQSQGIGAELLKFAVDVMNCNFLWALEYNKRAIAFYKKHGFMLTGEKIIEDEWVPLLKLSKSGYEIQLRKILQHSPDKSELDKINEEAFPVNERCSIDDLFASGRDGNLDIIGIYVNNELSGFFAVRKFGRIRYMAYFAVSSHKRSIGIGSKALQLLRNFYNGCQIVVEFEVPDNNCENNNIRIRRRDFYLRNGFFSTGWFSSYDDTEFEIACSEIVFDKHEFDKFIDYLSSIVPDFIPCPYRKFSDNMTYNIRKIRENEYSVLEDFLYEAIFIPDGVQPPPRNIIYQPELLLYISDFGKQKDDFCLVAEVGNRIVGAVWARIMDDYGHIDNNTPSLAISLCKDFRNYGIGTALLGNMLVLLKDNGYSQVSLSVQKTNYAVKMYRKAGFEVIDQNDEEFIMVCRL